MIEISLSNYKIKKIDMANNIDHAELVDINNTFIYKVKYNNDATKAIAMLSEKISSTDDSDKMHIDITIEGQFNLVGVNTEKDRKRAHVACYDKLFPYASQIVSQIAENSGLIGLLLKKVEMKEEDVCFVSEDDALALG